MKLIPYQQKFIEAISQIYSGGINRPLVSLPVPWASRNFCKLAKGISGIQKDVSLGTQRKTDLPGPG